VPLVVFDQCLPLALETILSGMSGHRKTVRRSHEPGDFHGLTFSCYRRLPLLTNDDWRDLLAQSIERAVEAQAFRLVAYVFMPEHIHLLVQPTGESVRIDLLLKAIKGPFSARIRRRLEEVNSPLLDQLTVRERPGVNVFRFWQEGGGYDRNLRSKAAVLATIDYIHENPVHRGLCMHAEDWPWSSARYYRDDCGTSCSSQVLPTVHGPTWDFFL
jgi:putative transposase